MLVIFKGLLRLLKKSSIQISLEFRHDAHMKGQPSAYQNQGCDNSPPLNKNLVPRFKRRVKEGGTQTNIIFTIQIALHKGVDSTTIFVSSSCSENSSQHDNKRKRKLWKDRSSRRSNNSGSTHGMRHSNISRAETRSTHLEGWSGTDDEGSLGRQQFHT